MGGGLMQLVAYGAQDIYLTGNPQITFFKVVYRRHTNFAMEAIEQTFSGVCNFGNKVSCTIARNGDLVSKMYLEVDLGGTDINNLSMTGTNTTLHRFGHKLIKTVEIDIGGQVIDKHYGEWLEIWSQLTHNEEQLQKLRKMIDGKINIDDSPDKLFIPLQFWFNRNPGLALPLIALQYHEVKLILEFEKKANIKFFASASSQVNYSSSQVKSITDYDNQSGVSKITLDAVTLYCDYVFLDTDERRRFAQVSHEYLIEQLQYNESVSAKRLTASQAKLNVDLSFNHPCKELVWVAQPESASGTYMFSSGTVAGGDDQGILMTLTGQLDINISKGDGIHIHTSIGGHHIGLIAASDITAGTGVSGNVHVVGFHKGSSITKNGNLNGLGSIGVATLHTDTQAGNTGKYGPPFNGYGTAALDDGNVTFGLAASGYDHTHNNSETELMANAKIQLNGHDRMQSRQGSYYRIVQPYQHHTGGHRQGFDNGFVSKEDGYIYCYSFALRPEEHQPSGTCNFSRIDNAIINMNLTNYENESGSEENVNVRVYAINYNVLRIMSGMGGLAYSN